MNFLSFQQALKTSFQALKVNKIRSFLTMLGIIIGVAAVIIIIALGAGAQGMIVGQIENLGSNLISITPGKSDDKSLPTSLFGITVTSLSLDDLKSLERSKESLGIEAVTAYVNGVGTASFRDNSYDTNLEGTTHSYLDVEGGELSAGRFFSEEENSNLARVAILGHTVKQELFGDGEAIGQRIKIKQGIFEVIGVLEERGQVTFRDYDDKIILPLKTMQKNILSINYLNIINIKAQSGVDIEELVFRVEDLIRSNHGISDLSGASDDFSVKNLTEFLDLAKTVTDALKYFLVLMASLSLIVGGIGIMNIMLISVNERTREIGLRKALGATNLDISQQFLFESIFLTLFGGIIGILSGIFFSWLVSFIMINLGYDWVFLVTPFSIILAISVSALVGFVFGWYPARRASQLEPVQALNYE